MKLNTTLMASAALIVATAAFFSLEGCSGMSADSYVDNTIAFNRMAVDKTYRAVGSAADYEAEHDLAIACRADLLIPTVAYGQPVNALQDSVFKLAFDTTANNHSDLVEAAFRRQAREVGFELADTTVADDVADGLFTARGDVAAMTSSVLSYAVTVSSYYPRAAHGMYTTRYLNYDIEGGKVFSLSDILTPQGVAQLPDMLKEIALKLKASIGPVELTALPSDNNFYVNISQDLVFVYQPYEIASYAQGEIALAVPVYLLADNLTPYGKKILNQY